MFGGSSYFEVRIIDVLEDQCRCSRLDSSAKGSKSKRHSQSVPQGLWRYPAEWWRWVHRVNSGESWFPAWSSSSWLAGKSRSKETHSDSRWSVRDVTDFEDFNDNFLVIGNIDSFEHFTVLATTELADDLIVILITKGRNPSISWTLIVVVTPIQPHAARSRSIRWKPKTNYPVCDELSFLPRSMGIAIGVDASSTRLGHQKSNSDNGQPEQWKEKRTMDLQGVQTTTDVCLHSVQSDIRGEYLEKDYVLDSWPVTINKHCQ